MPSLCCRPLPPSAAAKFSSSYNVVVLQRYGSYIVFAPGGETGAFWGDCPSEQPVAQVWLGGRPTDPDRYWQALTPQPQPQLAAPGYKGGGQTGQHLNELRGASLHMASAHLMNPWHPMCLCIGQRIQPPPPPNDSEVCREGFILPIRADSGAKWFEVCVI